MSTGTDGQSYITLSGVSRVCGYNPCGVWPYTSATSPTITVSEAYKIDTKMDDGLPQTGQTRAFYLARSASTIVGTWSTNAASDTATTCLNATNGTYSIGYNNGGGGNCALSFKFQ